MKTMIKMVESDDKLEFVKLVNNLNELYNVFATQTHVTQVVDKLVYTAILFHR